MTPLTNSSGLKDSPSGPRFLHRPPNFNYVLNMQQIAEIFNTRELANIGTMISQIVRSHRFSNHIDT